MLVAGTLQQPYCFGNSDKCCVIYAIRCIVTVKEMRNVTFWLFPRLVAINEVTKLMVIVFIVVFIFVKLCSNIF